MDIFTFPTFVFVILIVVKIMIFHGLKNLQQKQWLIDRVCTNGYYGLTMDPFECDAYYSCPQGIKLYCDQGQEFDPDKCSCVPIDEVDGCYSRLMRRLLL
ncbi:ORF11 [Xestia c-nigrum granulovirus]|uniref:AcNPV ORF145 homolog n=1 Tax=Xestia c-nigrum granulosis virus TaxID=51677 RepID=P89258_GVXN|nr:ORF11 [Xestia c-nigrum granulovirus]AAC12812.1 AcNPV ORF145 homolog [Xestia c-nigrum granulovirus]AAF05125.1 ORF11 [Xestia c-nigrum granulovirus]